MNTNQPKTRKKKMQFKKIFGSVPGENAGKQLFIADTTNSIDINFEKLWPKAFAEILLNCSGVDAQVLAYLLLMKNHNNQITESQRSMANRLHISKTSFNKSLKKFKELNLIRTARGGLMVNPDIIFYGKVERRGNACEEYKNFFDGPENTCSPKA